MKDVSLRIKITALAVLAGGLGMVIFGAIMGYKLQAAKLENLDNLLHKQTEGFFTAIHGRKTPINWEDDDSVRELFSIVRSLYSIEVEQPPGNAVYRSRNIGTQTLPNPVSGAATTMPLGDALVRVYEEEKDGTVFRIAADLGPTLATQRYMFIAFSVTLPSILLLLALGALWLTRKALKPVEEIAKLADAITATQLDQRLPVPKTNDEIGQLTVILNRMMDRLQQSFDQSRRFASDASHELKTPLTIIRGEVEAALRSGELSPTTERTMVNLQEETGRLVHIVEGLLLLSQADAGKLSLALSPLNLSEFVDEMAEDVEILANPKSIAFKLDIKPGIVIDGNPQFLRQVLLNLFDNAIKYNAEGGSLEARLEKRGNNAHFLIRNTGSGISDDARKHVFDRFFRAERSRDRASGGQGLGLSICAEIIRSHHGVIELVDDSSPGWTTFEFHIPISKTEA